MIEPGRSGDPPSSSRPASRRWGRRSLRLGVVACLLVVALACTGTVLAVSAADATGSGADPTAAPAPADGPASVQDVDADRTRITVDLRTDGDAAWRVEFRVQLDDAERREAFESVQADVETDPANVTADFRDRMQGSADVGSQSTGREMAVRDVSVSAAVQEIPNDGVLTYTFVWTNFSAVEGEELHAGDAVDGFFLEEGTRLTFRWPEGYAAAAITPEPDERTARRATWRGGETDFVAGEPRVVAAPEGGLLRWIAGGVGALLLFGGLAWLVLSGRLSLPGVGADAGGGGASGAEAGAAGGAAGTVNGGAGTADGAPETVEGAAETADSAAGTAGGETGTAPGANATADGDATGASAGVEGGAAAAGASDGSAATDEVPPELLSNEEQVLRVLEEHGGRTKQQQLVAELGWTEAKTSQVVTSMHDEDAIEKFRIGRENVLALPGEADL